MLPISALEEAVDAESILALLREIAAASNTPEEKKPKAKEAAPPPVTAGEDEKEYARAVATAAAIAAVAINNTAPQTITTTADMVGHSALQRWTLWTDKWKMVHGSPVLETYWQIGSLDAATFREFIQMACKITDSLEPNTGLHLCLEGIRPLYTDTANRQGGHFAIRLSQGEFLAVASGVWRSLAEAIVLGTLPHAEHITGVKIVSKPQSAAVQLWVRDSKAKDAITSLKALLFQILGPGLPVNFCPHRCILATIDQKRGSHAARQNHARSLRVNA